VNQELQNHGVEATIRKAYEFFQGSDVRLEQNTVTDTHFGTLRLKSIEYALIAVMPDGSRQCLFEAEISVSNDRTNPRVSVSATKNGMWDTVD
jgi:hypothetical protein